GVLDEPGSDDEFERNEHLVLHPTRSRTDASTYTVDKPRGEALLVIVEELAVLAELGIHIAVLLTHAWGPKGNIAAIAGVATWGYITVLASLRLLLSSSERVSFPKLWYHTAFLYAFQWMFTTLLFRSEIIHPRSKLAQALMSAHFALVTLLLVIALTSRKGNRAVEVEYEGDIEPSREPLASVLSLATFSWVDPIVWKGYHKTYELSDVWNLAPKDKAAAILANYRQVKRTSALAFHLLKYFKRGLLIQSAWAVLSGLNLFVPTLLLKVILEYVEDPDSTPRNAAWFYVGLLFVSGCVSALSAGQALWTGRKICVRLRAVIIGEIYAKALRRRAAARGGDRVLGAKKETEPKGSRLKKA
ncbi:Transporter of the ATP-binding cassette (ABC), partial [Cryomyces antarcticus]